MLLLLFTSLSFNFLFFYSIKSFSNTKRLFFTFKNRFIHIMFKYFFQYFGFDNLSFLSLYIHKNFKTKNIIFKTNRVNLSDFNWIHNSYNLHKSYTKVKFSKYKRIVKYFYKFCISKISFHKIFSIYIKMINKYYQKHKERLRKEIHER